MLTLEVRTQAERLVLPRIQKDEVLCTDRSLFGLAVEGDVYSVRVDIPTRYATPKVEGANQLFDIADKGRRLAAELAEELFRTIIRSTGRRCVQQTVAKAQSDQGLCDNK